MNDTPFLAYVNNFICWIVLVWVPTFQAFQNGSNRAELAKVQTRIESLTKRLANPSWNESRWEDALGTIGYACLAVAVPGSDIKGCTLKNASDEKLLALIGSNLNALEAMVDYNVQNGIALYRISSDLIPFGSSVARELDWQNIFRDRLVDIGDRIKRANMRVSMHPGQYTVLNSPDTAVAGRAAEDLDYHAADLDSLGLNSTHKIVLHLGGVYGDKQQAKQRFIQNYNQLSDNVKQRLIIENDGSLFNIEDVLETGLAAQIPVVFDNLHNAINPVDATGTVRPEVAYDLEWIRQCSPTWHNYDGPQKIHYSQQHHQKRPGAHSDSIRIDEFLDFYNQLDGTEVDIMLEVKDKNISAVKCLNCVSNRGISQLEVEWARYKYSILERSQESYSEIRQLLRDKDSYPALQMYRLVEAALALPLKTGGAINAAQHVWGYFKDKATDTEKKRFQRLLTDAASGGESGEANVRLLKKALLSLAKKYQEEYLLQGYYLYG